MMMMNKDMEFHHHHHQLPTQQVTGEENMSNLTSASGDQPSVSSNNRTETTASNFVNPQQQQCFVPQQQQSSQVAPKKKRNQPGNPDPEAEVIALSPKTLLATNRFVCEICNKGFQRDQNLQLHRRGHNLPWKLKQRSKTEVVRKKVYVCPEPGCVHHEPSRALGDLTGIKKHFCRKHGEKKWKCEKCSKRYAVQSDWKAHSKTCGTKEYRCDCGTLFSRRDSFITHRAFCDALAEESARGIIPTQHQQQQHLQTQPDNNTSLLNIPNLQHYHHNNNNNNVHALSMKIEQQSDINYTSRPPQQQQQQQQIPSWLAPGPTSPASVFSHPNPSGGGFFPFHHPSSPSPAMSATALLQKAAQMGATTNTTTTTTTAPSPADDIRSSSSSSQTLTTTMAAMMTSTATPAGFANNNNHSMFQEYNAFDHGEAFDESFGGFLRTSGGAAVAGESNNGGGGGGGGEGMTRDFLGLRALSHSDILSFAGLGDCIHANAASSHHHHCKPWQGN